MPGTYLAGVHELRTMVYTETGNGDPESTETLVNTIDGTAVRLLVEGHPLDVRTGSLLHHERVLDFRAGTLSRELRWRSPGGRAVEVSSTRLVSLDQRGVLALRYTVRALERPAEVVLQSGLVANTQQPHLPSHPSADDLLQHPLEPQEHDADGRRLTLMHRTLRTGLLVGAAAHHDVDGRRRGRLCTARPRPTTPGSPCARSWSPASRSRSPSSWPTRGRATASCPRCATSSPAPSPSPATRASTGCSRASARSSTASGSAQTSRSTATPSCSRPSGSRCSSSCRTRREPRAGGSRARRSPAPATRATPSGTRRRSSCRS